MEENNNGVERKSANLRPIVQNRNIALAIILTIITCGIYSIVWFIFMVDDVNNINSDEKSQSGGIVFLLSLITCGIYGIVWFYQAAKRMEESGKKYGIQISDNSIIYLVLNLLGFSIISYGLLQSDLNKFSA